MLPWVRRRYKEIQPYGEIPASRWNVPPLDESCMRVKVWETQR